MPRPKSSLPPSRCAPIAPRQPPTDRDRLDITNRRLIGLVSYEQPEQTMQVLPERPIHSPLEPPYKDEKGAEKKRRPGGRVQPARPAWGRNSGREGVRSVGSGRGGVHSVQARRVRRPGA